jgi:serine/threonine-protein kinase
MPLPPNRILPVTQDYHSPDYASLPKARHRCRIAAAEITGTGFTSELEHLLRSRLRTATAIIALTYFAFFLRFLFLSKLFLTEDYVIMAVTTLVTGLAAVLLWSPKPISHCWLHRLELLVFGVCVAHFAQVNYRWMTDTDWVQLLAQVKLLAQNPATQITDKEIYHIWRSASQANASRWFVIIVVYGVFIPNTGKRCATFVGTVALIPIALFLWDGWYYGEERLWFHLTQNIPDTAIFLVMGAAIAIFGSAKFRSLQQQVFASQRLGQYQLKRRLGVGGMGEVYLAEHVLLKRPCVVKLIRADRASDRITQARFEREVRATATLTHWNTVEIFDYGHTDDGTFYYVMEYLPGLSLQEIISTDGPMPAARAVHILEQVCGALHEAHSIGLIHRDIKPSNILVCQRGGLHDVAKLLDFGLVHNPAARESNTKLTREGYIVGTPDFMSPEQGQGVEPLDGTSDIYSLGAVGFFLLTGQPPFVRRTAVEAVVAHAHDPVPPLSDYQVPAEVEAVIRKCLEKKPDQRYPTARALGRELASLAQLYPWTEEEATVWWNKQKAAPAVKVPDESTVDSPVPV